MSVSLRHRRLLAAIIVGSIVLAAAVAVIAGQAHRRGGGPTTALRGKRVVIFTMPGVTWAHTRTARMPVFDRLVRQGASAALAPRSASTHPSAVRGYLTLGAGNRTAAAHDSAVAQEAYEASEEVSDGVTARAQFEALTGRRRAGAVVHLGVAALAARQRMEYHGADVGALGESLALAGIERGVVSAADREKDAVPPENGRGAPVLAMVDHWGAVEHGVIRGLVERSRSPGVPYGVVTDRAKFARAVQETLDVVRVLMVEPGETLRADELAEDAFPDAAQRQRVTALERTDRLLGDVVDRLDTGDLLLIVAPTSPSGPIQEHLVPVVAWGNDVGDGLLVSATTRRPGIVTLTDIAPTVLESFGVERPSSMSGRAMRDANDDGLPRPDVHEELDARSVFRERFVPSVFYGFVGLFVILSVLVGLVFLRHLPLRAPLVAVCYVILAVPLATFVLSAAPLWQSGVAGAHMVLWAVAILAAGAGLLVPGPRWVGGIPLLAATVAFVGTDLLAGGHLLVNGVFGNSVLAAGRFYGIPNTGSALFLGASVLTLAAIGELWPALASRLWLSLGFVVVLALIGLPPFGADVGGLITGVAAAAMFVLVIGERTVRWRVVAIAVAIAILVTLGVAYIDSLRPAATQTHLGRFGESLFGGDAVAARVLTRKASQSWASLSFSRFTWVVPLGIAALGVLLRRPRGAARTALPDYPLFRAALAAFLVAGVLGFAVNDSGVAVPAMLLAQAVPFVVLLGVDDATTRSSGNGRSGAPQHAMQPLQREERDHAHEVRAEVDGDADE